MKKRSLIYLLLLSLAGNNYFSTKAEDPEKIKKTEYGENFDYTLKRRKKKEATVRRFFKDVLSINMSCDKKLLEAVKNRESTETIIDLITPATNLEIRDDREQTPLCIAAKLGDAETVRVLIELGAKVNASCTEELRSTTRHFMTPLHLAAVGGHIKTVELLVKNGAKVNAENTYRETPLCYSAVRGHLEVSKFLVKNGAKVNSEWDCSKSPVNLAAMGGNLETVKFLVENGAKIKDNDVGVRLCVKNVTLVYAADHNHTEIVEYLRNIGEDNEANKKKTENKKNKNKKVKNEEKVPLLDL